MREFVVYYNPDKVGEIIKANPLSAYTRKKVSEDVIGGRLWLITGVGNPRTYYLKCWFIIEYLDNDPERPLTMCIGGFKGHFFDPMVEIDSSGDWFQTFKKNQGHFAFGFNPIKESQTIEQLEKLAGI